MTNAYQIVIMILTSPYQKQKENRGMRRTASAEKVAAGCPACSVWRTPAVLPHGKNANTC
jgi:hypothetical protein